jgi:hypothetical protein
MKRNVWTLGFGLWLLPYIAVTSFAQITFERTYGGADSDGGKSVQQTSDGGYIIAGFTSSFGAGGDVYLVKTDSLGDTLWTKTFGGSFGDEAWSVRETSDGGYIIAGSTNSFGAGLSDAYLIKTNSLGDTLWTKTLGGIDYDFGNSVQQTSDGGYIVAGVTESFGAGLYDAYLIKTDSLGDTLWTKTYGDSGWDYGNSVQQTSDGGYIIAGSTNSFGVADNEVYLIKTNSFGDNLWTRTYGGPFNDDDHGFSVQQASDGGYIIAGTTQSFGTGNYVYLIKTDSLGDSLWTRTYGDTLSDQGHSVQQTSDGGYIIAGSTNSFGAGLDDVYLIKTDGNGMVVGVEESNDEYRTRNFEFRLLQNHPNPFHKLTTIIYNIPNSHHVSLNIYDITGSLVETLVNETQKHGVYQVQWDGKDQSSGIYFYRLQTNDITQIKKMILLR